MIQPVKLLHITVLSNNALLNRLLCIHSSKICNNTHKTVKKTVMKNIMGHGINH